jgi:hypothetical protein
MARMTRHAAYHKLLKVGPWKSGSAHGYHSKIKECETKQCEEWKHESNGKYGQGYKHCLFCSEDIPFHREYCPWQDFFHSWEDPNPMEVEYTKDKDVVPFGCKPIVHSINEA